MGLNIGVTPNTAKTALDKVLMSEFELQEHPGFVNALNTTFFKQERATNSAVIFEEYQPPAEFEETSEEQAISEASIRTGNQTTRSILKYAQELPISSEYFADDQHSIVQRSVRELARKARNSRDKFAFEKTYGNGFSATTPDGVALYSNSHTALSGDTIDNLETGALTPDNLETLVESLELQKDQNGDLGGHVAVGLLVPRVLHADATEITKSTLQANTGENNLNYWSELYPGLQVGFNPRLDSTYNSLNSNAATSYFVVSRSHFITRYERESLSTVLVPPEYDKYDRYMYRVKYREVVAPDGWEGTAGSNGTA